jgi:TolB protein
MVTMDPVGRVVKLFDGGEHPAWSPDGGRVVFQETAGDLGANDIFVIDADGTGVRNLTNTEADIEVEPIWSPDGSRIVFTTGDLPHLEIMNADGTGRRVLLKSHSGAASWSPDGSRVAFLAPTEFGLDFGLFTMRPDGSGLTQLTPGAMTADGPASWSPAGDRLAFAGSVNGFEDVFVIGADGTGLTNISNTPRVNEYLGPQAWGR